MNERLRRIGLVAVVALVIVGLLGGVLGAVFAPDFTGSLTDGDAEALASRTPEAQTFLALHPDASVRVDRSGLLAVDYRAGTLRLRLLVDEERRIAVPYFLECGGDVVQERIRESIAAGRCLR